MCPFRAINWKERYFDVRFDSISLIAQREISISAVTAVANHMHLYVHFALIRDKQVRETYNGVDIATKQQLFTCNFSM